jgi:hypoxanthine phosphoribosyltransferase
MVMKGAIHLTADLMRKITVPCMLEYVRASSYGLGMVSGELTLQGIEGLFLQGKHVIIIDDIFDTGKTMTAIKEKLLLQQPASLKTLVLLLKNRPRTIISAPDYVLFPIEDEFVIGYGLDYQERYRGLPGVFIR